MSASADTKSSGEPTAPQRTGIVKNSAIASILTTAALLASHCLVTLLLRSGFLNKPNKSTSTDSVSLGTVLVTRLPLIVLAIYLQRWLTGTREINPWLNLIWSSMVMPFAYLDGSIGV